MLEGDTKHWRASDAADARRDSDAIMDTIAAARITGTHADLRERVFTLLRRSYDEIRATA